MNDEYEQSCTYYGDQISDYFYGIVINGEYLFSLLIAVNRQSTIGSGWCQTIILDTEGLTTASSLAISLGYIRLRRELQMLTYPAVNDGANIPTIASMTDRGSVDSYDTQLGTIDGSVANPPLTYSFYTVIGVGKSSVPITFTSAYAWNTAPTWGTNDNGATWTNVDSENPSPTGATSNTYTGYQYYTWISDKGRINTAASDFQFGSDDVAKVISKDEDANTITVDGGDWAGSDGSGTPGEQTTLVKETPYDTKLTVDGSI